MITRLRRLSEQELLALSEAVDGELQRRFRRRQQRGYQWTSYMNDRVRGRRQARRTQRNEPVYGLVA